MSPNKTWSGAISGALGGLVAGLTALAVMDVPVTPGIAAMALALSAAAQLGDLFESAVKRRFGRKDSSHLIPGHGGVMDRVDGLVAAAVVAALAGWLAAPHAPATGLLRW